MTELAVGPFDATRPGVGRTSTLVGDELTVRGQVRWRHAGQQAVDQGGDLKVHPLPTLKPVQLV